MPPMHQFVAVPRFTMHCKLCVAYLMLAGVIQVVAAAATTNQVASDRKSASDDEEGPYEVHTDHIPKVISLDAECSKRSMRIQVVFDKPYSGGIYPRNHFNNKDCLLLPWGGTEKEYEFDLILDECGTESSKMHSSRDVIYMTNTLIFQYDPNFRGKWDTVRDVQCWFLDRSNHTALKGFNVDIDSPTPDVFQMTDVSVGMDLKSGRGPFEPNINRVVKVGDFLTLVISIFSSKKVDVQVRQCSAHRGSMVNPYQLTDERGCILKKKVMGAWTFTRDTNKTGAAVLAYAYMQAFRFPDTLDFYVECNVEVCAATCPDHCPDYPSLDLRTDRRKRETSEHQQLRGMASINVALAGRPPTHRFAVQPDICFSHTAFFAVMAGIPGLLLLAFVTVFSMFCLKLYCSKSEDSQTANKDEKF